MGFEDYMNYLDENNLQYPYEALHMRGWVRLKVYHPNRLEILGNCISLVRPQKNTIDPAMNPTQLKVAKRLCEETGTSFHEAVNERRFW